MVAVLLLLLSFLPIVKGELLGKLCRGDWAGDGYYQDNLVRLSAALLNGTSSLPFHFADLETINGLSLCRGDANASACGDCIKTALETVQHVCANSMEMVIFYDMCLLSISYQDFIDDELVYGVVNTMNTTEPKLPGWDPSDPSGITEIIHELLVETSKPAAYVYPGKRYVTAFMDATANSLLLYSMAQCIPDLTSIDCWTCLTNITEIAMASFIGQRKGGVLSARCVLRYDTNVFYSGIPMWFINPAVVSESAPPPIAMPNLKHTREVSKVLVISVVVPLFASFFCLVVSLGLIRRRRKALNERAASNPEFGFIPRQRKALTVDLGKGPHDKAKMNVEGDETLVWEIEGRVSEFKVYDLSQVMEATSNFSERNKLGQGGFGPVYKGELPDGLDIAVKRLSSRSVQGFTEFKNEIQLIAKLQHRNLVRLLGCCCQGEEKILIYEYLPNKSLDFFIFDPVRKYIINWTKRLAIIEGIAQGMLYLHKHSRLRVIHRDLKASNILLDPKMNPKISDFGLAKIFSINDTEGNTERIAGTFGYMAPEYASEGLFSVKSDVFSFGVLLLEIVSGKRSSIRSNGYGDFINLLGHAWQLWKDGLWLQLVDASLATKCRAIEIKRCINIALLCVQENAADRPSMAQVVAMLSSESVTLLEPKHPAYFHIRVGNEDVSTFIELSSSKDVTVPALDGK